MELTATAIIKIKRRKDSEIEETRVKIPEMRKIPNNNSRRGKVLAENPTNASGRM